MNTIDLPLITKGDISGYEVTALTTWLETRGLDEAFAAWFNGQTGGIVEGQFIVYSHDAERFLQGLPAFD